MIEWENSRDTIQEYRMLLKQLGRKEFTFLKMMEYGFWPKYLPTPYEKQISETEKQYEERKNLMDQFNQLVDDLSSLYRTKREINTKLRELQKEYAGTYDIAKIRKEITKNLMEESKKKRAAKKEQRELEKEARSLAWHQKKSEEIVFIGEGYSTFLYNFEINVNKLSKFNLPLINSSQELAKLLDLSFKQLKFLTYHRNVVTTDHYHRYKIPKRSGGTRQIAAPKPILKNTQRKILDKILSIIPVTEYAHGFLKQRSVLTNANQHPKQPYLIINMDLENFFPSITFERVRGMFHSLGYSGHISTLLAMICTYCERVPILVKNKTRYVAISKRVLPQGSPASPMITNIICRRLDYRINGLAKKFGVNYSRYADDMSFSLKTKIEMNLGKFLGFIYQIVEQEGFTINNSKTRFLRGNNQQNITGVVINNSELGIPKNWIKRYRATIYNANKQLKENGNLEREKLYEISGMASWVKSVNHKKYKSLLDSTSDLIQKWMKINVKQKT